MAPNFRVGLGFDVHQLVKGRELWLGGVRIEHEFGCDGHSDADVLLHAICDALLGAGGMRDIGFHFPNTEDAYKNIDSKILLEKVVKLLAEKSWIRKSLASMPRLLLARQARSQLSSTSMTRPMLA